jgi:predicted SnoaL-like aldol condensation-catalyzing enzyme
MRPTSILLTMALAVVMCHPVAAQVSVIANANHEQMLASSDSKAASNKRLVYDFFREVFEAGRIDLAPKYLAENYIQHNPNLQTGRAAFMEFFSKNSKSKPTEPRLRAPIVAIVSEGDLVMISFVREGVDPQEPTRKFTTTLFDLFRVENGLIAEHWDHAVRR